MAQSSSTPLKPCTICQSESSIVVPSLAAPKNFCLLHYFGTGIHRKRSKNKRSKLFVHPLRLKSQLSDVQDLFSEAFVELQKEIREESVRGLDLNLNLDSAELRNFGRRYGKGNNSRKSGDVSNNDENNNHAEFEDPLAALLDAGTPSHHRRMLGMKGIKISSAGNAKASSSSTSMNGTDSNARPKHTNHSSNPSAAARTRTKFTRQQRDEDIAGEGGFIREAALPDKLRKFQENAAIDLDLNHWQNNATKKNSDGLEASSGKSGSGRVPVAVSKSSVNSNSKTAGSSKPSNPYNPTKRRNRTSTWNQVLNSTSPTHEHDKDGDRELSGHDQPSKKPKKTSWEEMEKQMIQNITSTSTSAPCNSNNNNAVIASGPKCTSCASTNIESHGNITSRNNDVRKGEVWGMKDRGEMVVERYRCLNCGKVWNEE